MAAGDGRQRLAQAAGGGEAAAAEGVGGGEGHEVEVAAQGQMGEAVVEQEEVGRGLEAAQRLQAGLPAVRADHHGHPGQLAGEQHRLVAGHQRPEERPARRCYHPHSPPLAAVAARQDADAPARGRADGRRRRRPSGVLPVPPQWRLPTLITGRGSRPARVRYHRRRRRWAPP